MNATKCAIKRENLETWQKCSLFSEEESSSAKGKSIKNVHCKCDLPWQRRSSRLFSFDMDTVTASVSLVRSIGYSETVETIINNNNNGICRVNLREKKPRKRIFM